MQYELETAIKALERRRVTPAETWLSIYPHTLFQLGLQAALEGLVDNFCRVSHLDVERSIQGVDDCCSDEVALLAFRIVQEGLTNVAKHANAS